MTAFTRVVAFAILCDLLFIEVGQAQTLVQPIPAKSYFYLWSLCSDDYLLDIHQLDPSRRANYNAEMKQLGEVRNARFRTAASQAGKSWGYIRTIRTFKRMEGLTIASMRAIQDDFTLRGMADAFEELGLGKNPNPLKLINDILGVNEKKKGVLQRITASAQSNLAIKSEFEKLIAIRKKVLLPFAAAYFSEKNVGSLASLEFGIVTHGEVISQEGYLSFKPRKNLTNCRIEVSVADVKGTTSQSRTYFVPEIKSGQRLQDTILLSYGGLVPVPHVVKFTVWSDQGYQKEQKAIVVQGAKLFREKILRFFQPGTRYVHKVVGEKEKRELSLKITRQVADARGVVIIAEMSDSSKKEVVVFQGLWTGRDRTVSMLPYARVKGRLISAGNIPWGFTWDDAVCQLTATSALIQVSFVPVGK